MTFFPGQPACRLIITGAHVRPQALPAAQPEIKLHEVRSPIVGTFYRAPLPTPNRTSRSAERQRWFVLCIVER